MPGKFISVKNKAEMKSCELPFHFKLRMLLRAVSASYMFHEQMCADERQRLFICFVEFMFGVRELAVQILRLGM